MIMKDKRKCFQWNIYLVELKSGEENIQNGLRPCVCISNNKNNIYSNTVQFIPLSSQIKNELPMHYVLYKSVYKFLKTDSVILPEQLTTENVDNVVKFLGSIEEKDIQNIKNCIKIQFDL